jgi:hypothetical protein
MELNLHVWTAASRWFHGSLGGIKGNHIDDGRNPSAQRRPTAGLRDESTKEPRMRRALCLVSLAALGATVLAFPAGASTTLELKAQFHDFDTCPVGVDECGKGVVKRLGTASTTLVFTSFVPGPGTDCVTGTADRIVTLDADGSTLLLAIAGTICDHKIAGTFSIVGGTGVFAGAAGSGTLRGVAIPGVPGDSVHLTGTLTLP